WHRRETRRQTEKTNLNLQHRKKPVYLTQPSSAWLGGIDNNLPIPLAYLNEEYSDGILHLMVMQSNRT
ncbi:hypothetical protein KA005_23745, partial [bacterium]|nr:hypothetical protein [bacterium]